MDSNARGDAAYSAAAARADLRTAIDAYEAALELGLPSFYYDEEDYLAEGDAEAEDLDTKVSQSAVPLGRLGVEGFWTPACRDLVMQLPVGSCAVVLDAFKTEANYTAAL